MDSRVGRRAVRPFHFIALYIQVGCFMFARAHADLCCAMWFSAGDMHLLLCCHIYIYVPIYIDFCSVDL